MSQAPQGARDAAARSDSSPTNAPGMIASAVLFLLAAGSIVVPQLIEVGTWLRVLGPVVGVILLAVGSVVFARELRRQAVLRR